MNLRSKYDGLDVRKEVKKGIKFTLWYDGLSIVNPKRKQRVQSDDDNEGEEYDARVKRSKNRKEEGTKLKDKHGNLFSTMQFRIWSEMIAGELSMNPLVHRCSLKLEIL